MTASEVGRLVKHLGMERRVWLLDTIDLKKTIAWFESYPYDRPLCSYVESRLLGLRPTVHLSHHSRVNGAIRRYSMEV